MAHRNLNFSWLLISATAVFGLFRASGEDLSTRASDETLYRRANPQMAWGAVTNFARTEPWATNLPTSMRLALDVRSEGIIILSGQPLKPEKPARLLILNATGPLSRLVNNDTVNVDTNAVSVYLPPVQQRIELSMTDSEGAPVARTREGARLGAPLALREGTPFHESTREMKRKRLFKAGVFSRAFTDVPFADEYAPSMTARETSETMQFDPTKYFVIKEPGLYKLTATVRFYVHGTNDLLQPIVLPPVEVDVRVE